MQVPKPNPQKFSVYRVRFEPRTVPFNKHPGILRQAAKIMLEDLLGSWHG